MKFNSETKTQLMECARSRGVFLEGNILKLIDPSGDDEFSKYITASIERDTESRRKRLDMTKQVQQQNNELVKWKSENEKINSELKQTLQLAEKSKEAAVNDLDVLQKRTQNQLIESIVKVSLWIISGIGVITTVLFAITLLKGIENKIVESMWSNMFGILLTNCFSIIGTIMGVKYASSGSKNSSKNCKCKNCD